MPGRRPEEALARLAGGGFSAFLLGLLGIRGGRFARSAGAIQGAAPFSVGTGVRTFPGREVTRMSSRPKKRKAAARVQRGHAGGDERRNQSFKKLLGGPPRGGGQRVDTERTGSLRAPRQEAARSARLAPVSQAMAAINEAVAKGARLRASIEAKIESGFPSRGAKAKGPVAKRR